MIREPWRTIVVALLDLAVFVTGVVVVGTHPDEISWDAKVLPLVHFVEQERGLTFKHAVPVEFLSDKAFQQQVAPDREETAKEKQQLQDLLGELRALGLVSGDVDLRKAEDDLQKSSVIGLYVPSKKRVFVRGTALTPAVRVTLAHELTHVLQDQWFDLEKIQRDAPGGDDTAATALIEGDAVRVQDAYAESLSSSDLAAYHREELAEQRSATDATADVPPVLSDLLAFPYAFGPVLLADLVQQGGNDEVDKAFRHPPSEEAQVFDPGGHPYTEKAVALPQPSLPAGAKRVGGPAPFGQVSLFEVLSTRLAYAPALTAVRGWTADTSQSYKLGGRTCVAVDVQADADPAALVSGVRRWAAASGATVTVAGDTVRIRSCDPGASVRVPVQPHPTPVEVLQGRAALVATFLTKGATYQRSTCIADGLLARLGPSRYGVLLAGSLTPAQTATVRESVTAASAACG